VNMLDKQSCRANMLWSSSLEGELKNHCRITSMLWNVAKRWKVMAQSKQWEKDMKWELGTLGVCMACSVESVARELVKCKFYLAGIQFTWGRDGIEPVNSYVFYYGIGIKDHLLVINIFLHKRVRSAVKRENS